ncbi:ATP-grasp domain-containing protein [Nitrosospira sp. Nsp2]|uniref:ATP-grasp domain-containing protein n=1 Tax=Nitrosospira sp. Nsp2 TaxID=136548 RepID=UPI000D482D84|nr:ATP-grasp domain-containing protein [Nitrosospira sp. Nsp2]PTR17669.1 ATP-grasp domain-containing protein [Nitrosospira sp. Nsp2]
MDKLEALLIGGYWPELMAVTLGLLIRAGFTVDVICNNTAFRRSSAIRDYVLVKKRDLLARTAAEKIRKDYSLVVIGDDATLGVILNSDLTHEQKLRLLPILSDKNFGHIFSKIGLSLALEENGISTPEYRIARNEGELAAGAETLGYPILVKLDSSAGGVGIFECLDKADVEDLRKTLKLYPVLVQRKVKGVEVSLEAFYRHGELVHFAYSIPEKSKYRFGPTSVRSYQQIASLEPQVSDELRRVGKALGSHGFTSVGCIHAEHDKKRYYFEADMRPNLWIDQPRYLGEDWAKIIQRHFAEGAAGRHAGSFDISYPNRVLIPHYLRLTWAELIFNRYGVWKYLPENFLYVLIHYRILTWARWAVRKVYGFFLPKKVRVFFKRVRLQISVRSSPRTREGQAHQPAESHGPRPSMARLEDRR